MTAQQLLETAVAHHKAGRLADAERCYRQVLAGDPNHPDALHLVGLAASGAGKSGEAIEFIRRAIAIAPVNPVYHSNLGNILAAAGRFDEAIASYRRSIELKPDFASPHNNLGSVLKDTGHLEEAVAEYRRAIALNPKMAEAHSNLGDVLTEQGKYEEAIAALHRAIELNPAMARAHCNLGVTVQRSGKIGEAIACYRRAISLDPAFAKAHNNLGIALRETGKLDEAVAECGKAVELDANSTDAHWSLALALLLAGDFRRGLTQYEWRWRRKDLPWNRRTFVEPRWNGEALRGRTLLIHAEQGLGDTIQFCRYLPMIERGEGRLVFESQPAVARLMRENFPEIEVVAWGEPLPRVDLQCALISLPLVFTTEVETIPAGVPYLKADLIRSRHWAERLADVKEKKIGIVWAGSTRHPTDRHRSLVPEALMSLNNIPGATLFSLQKFDADDTRPRAPGELKLMDHTAELIDFTDTAALVENLDLIISVDTAVAHLAGAIGKPVWVLLPHAPDWRWMLEREDSPWYPTMRLFRQRRSGDWEEVIQRVVEALKAGLKTP